MTLAAPGGPRRPYREAPGAVCAPAEVVRRGGCALWACSWRAVRVTELYHFGARLHGAREWLGRDDGAAHAAAVFFASTAALGAGRSAQLAR